VRKLEFDRGKYHKYFRMSPEKLKDILGSVGPLVTKKGAIREPLGAKIKLAICVYFHIEDEQLLVLLR